MPRLGLGTWPFDDAEAERVIADALQAGYRLVDTAWAYHNERGVGRGVKASGIPREDVFITSKFDLPAHSIAGVREAYGDAIGKLGVDYLDLFLIHWPNPWADKYVDAWRGLIALLESGDVRAIGMSNFTPAHLERVVGETGVVPDVDQVELNPWTGRRDVREYNAAHGIVTQSWGPIGQGGGLLDDPVIVDVAARNDCTPAQAVLAWHLANGLAVVAKSGDANRLRSNLAAVDITLPADDIAALDALDGRQRPTDPERFGH